MPGCERAVRLVDFVIRHCDSQVQEFAVPQHLEGGGEIARPLPFRAGHTLPGEEELLLVHDEGRDIAPLGQVAVNADFLCAPMRVPGGPRIRRARLHGWHGKWQQAGY